MLTRRGWFVAALAGVCLVGGRVLGVADLTIAGVALAAVTAISAVWVASIRLRLSVQRSVRPRRVHAGTLCRVELAVRNLGRRRAPVLRVADAVTGTPGAAAEIGPIPPGDLSRVGYALPTARRGLIGVGPLRITLSDPLGLSRVDLTGAPRDEVTVLPRVVPLLPVPSTLGRDPHGGADNPNSLGRVGDEFYALRDYVIGDDLRRVHWPSTARRDDLMIRQDELPWQGRLTVLVDLRRGAFPPDGLDLAADLAASVVVASAKRRDLVRLLTTGGGDSGFGSGHNHLDAILEHLAVTDGDQPGSLHGTLAALRGRRIGGALVVIGSDLPATERDAVFALRSTFGDVVLVDVHPSAWDDGVAVADATAAGVVQVTGEVPFDAAWDRAMTAWRRAGAGT